MSTQGDQLVPREAVDPAALRQMAQQSINRRQLTPAVQGELIVKHHVSDVHVRDARVNGSVEPCQASAHIKVPLGALCDRDPGAVA